MLVTPQSCVGLCGEGNNSWHPCAHLNDEREWAQHREPCQQCSVSSACMHAHVVPIFTSRDVPLAAAARVSPHGSGVDLCTHAAVRCDTQGRLTQGSTVVHACKHRNLSECARHTWQSWLVECARHTHRHLTEWQSVPVTRIWQSVSGTRTGTWQSVPGTRTGTCQCVPCASTGTWQSVSGICEAKILSHPHSLAAPKSLFAVVPA